MSDIFLADAHLLHPSDNNYRRLLGFLEGLRGQTRTLYILGDLFEFWIGYRHVVFAPYVPVLEALRRLRESGTGIVYVEGNHDFHLGPYFEKTLGCRILPDGGDVAIDGKRVLVVHGDLIHPGDQGYKMLRKVLRSRMLRGVGRLVPPDWAWGIARWAGRQSQKKHAGPERTAWAEKMLRAYGKRCFSEGYDAVVTGHFHLPLFEEREGRTLVALGDWVEQFSYARWENGRFSLETY